jgi:hypothetical protein
MQESHENAFKLSGCETEGSGLTKGVVTEAGSCAGISNCF